jgi:hypothetical protein
MRRYYREDDGTIYDRRRRRHIKADTEKLIGGAYYLNLGKPNEYVIPVDEVEERR